MRLKHMPSSQHELENLKLKYEIRELSKPVYNKAAFWTLLVAVAAAFYTWQSGILDTKGAILELRSLRLEDTVRVYQNTRDSLRKETDSLQVVTSELQQQNLSLQTTLHELSSQSNGLDGKIQLLLQQKLSLERMIRDTTAFYNQYKRMILENQNGYAEGLLHDITNLGMHITECHRERNQLQNEVDSLKKSLSNK